LGGAHLNPAPLAGMVKILDWPGFLSFLLPRFNERTRSLANIKDGDCLGLEYLNQELHGVWRNSIGWEMKDDEGILNSSEFERFFTKMILGFYDTFDLSRIRTRDISIINSIFPKKYPFIWDNNYLY
jgi:hypothetical protein